MRIKILPAHIANHIAAGEVVERPASVIKELLENALDANATNINIEIIDGGISYIKLSDNGNGIDAQDLPLAIKAHATSKINNLHDLYDLKTMGFRGEALASIAAISKITIISKPDEQEYGMAITNLDNSQIPKPTPRTNGTTIIVEDLFYNAPVRKKFLKSIKTEYLIIEKLIKKFALAAPHIAINFMHNKNNIFSLPVASNISMQETRLQRLFGKNFMQQALYFTVTKENLELKGWISNKEYQRNQNDKIWIYVNNRMVQDKLLYQAIKKAYAQYLHPGKFPTCVLYLSLPNTAVDVNVHPTKNEVRFEEPRIIHDFIVHNIIEVLNKSKAQQEMSLTYDNNVINKPSRNYSLDNKIFTNNIKKEWIVLNNIFAIITINNYPHFVDVKILNADYKLKLLKGMSFPLEAQDLFSPITIKNLLPAKIELIEKEQKNLENLGININIIGIDSIIIKTIPKVLPLINLESFINLFDNKVINNLKFFDLLVQSQDFNANYLTIEDQNILQSHLENLLSETDELFNWCKCLDLKSCENILYG